MRLYSHMSEEQSPPGYRTSCARGNSQSSVNLERELSGRSGMVALE